MITVPLRPRLMATAAICLGLTIGIAAAGSALNQTKHTSSPSLADAESTIDAINALHNKLTGGSPSGLLDSSGVLPRQR